MTAHELAEQLLKMPDVVVQLYDDTWGWYDLQDISFATEKWRKSEIEVVRLY